MTDLFNQELRRRATAAIVASGNHALEDGLYIDNGSDTFETGAEIAALDRLTKGFNPYRVVGMTTVPEAILAAQLAIQFVAICSPVNPAQGISTSVPATHEQTLAVIKRAEERISGIVRRIILGYDRQA